MDKVNIKNRSCLLNLADVPGPGPWLGDASHCKGYRAGATLETLEDANVALPGGEFVNWRPASAVQWWCYRWRWLTSWNYKCSVGYLRCSVCYYLSYFVSFRLFSFLFLVPVSPDLFVSYLALLSAVILPLAPEHLTATSFPPRPPTPPACTVL